MIKNPYNHYNEANYPPLPHDLESAVVEVTKLRRLLVTERLKICKLVEQKELLRRSHQGEIAVLKRRIADLEGESGVY